MTINVHLVVRAVKILVLDMAFTLLLTLNILELGLVIYFIVVYV
jgi:hypothetical protein